MSISMSASLSLSGSFVMIAIVSSGDIASASCRVRSDVRHGMSKSAGSVVFPAEGSLKGQPVVFSLNIYGI